ncbi:dipeptide ABC transporter ATP-binding protein [Amycolatopsis sp. NPDC059027]|uniref:dipeptide ABC transporter ATP-binding protein n=1 Tax=Amycolatopsis sp. NPDC059027 TaxID=3346709 RepID=UPI00366D53B2
MTGGKTLLRVRNLTVTHDSGGGPRTLVREVGFDVAPGEAVCLVGESGSGKSMTAKALISLLPPSVRAGGSAVLSGTELSGNELSGNELSGTELIGADESTLRGLRGRELALLMQDPFTMLNPVLTIGTHLAESLAVRGNQRTLRAEIQRRLDEVGITDPAVAAKYPFQLSGGMLQRVALAAALAKDPALLIADEPTTALDVTTQSEILALLKEIQRTRRMGLVFITHDLRVAMSVSERVLVMYAGSMVERSPATAITAAPAHPYTAGLLRSVPSVHVRTRELAGIPGSVPHADDVADRCPFADRCSWAEPDCTADAPALTERAPGRFTACIAFPRIADELAATVAESEVDGPDRQPDGATVLQVTGLRKSFYSGRSKRHGIEVLHGVDLTLRAGSSLGVLGESGSGKTTLVRCLLGLTEPTEGIIELDGVDVTSYRRLGRRDRVAARRAVQCVFQDPYSSLNPALSVGSTLAEAVRRREEVPADVPAEVRELLRTVGLPQEFSARKPAVLSGGQRQRVAIARALAVRPKLIVCDEPVAALDVSVQAQILGLLRELTRQTGTSLLFITHDLAVARQITDDVLVLYRGDVVEHGPTARVLDTPVHAYTRKLIGSLPKSFPGPKKPAGVRSSAQSSPGEHAVGCEDDQCSRAVKEAHG